MAEEAQDAKESPQPREVALDDLLEERNATKPPRLEGTFTEPMVTADGTVIEPTGRAFTIPMATLGRWEDGTMSEEWLFWDNQLFMRQIGLAE